MLSHLLFALGALVLAALAGAEAYAKIRQWSIDIRREKLDELRKDAWKKANEREKPN